MHVCPYMYIGEFIGYIYAICFIIRNSLLLFTNTFVKIVS